MAEGSSLRNEGIWFSFQNGSKGERGEGVRSNELLTIALC